MYSTMLPIHTTAPDFELPDSSGTMHSLAMYRGKNVVLVFYPKDNSPVCTTQLSEYSNNYNKFRDKGAVILAVSGDSEASHGHFAESCRLIFPLLSDPGKRVAKLYDAISIIGTVQRAVYLIDVDGMIIHASNTFPLFFVKSDELLELL